MLGSVQRELDTFFKELFGRRVSDREVSASAFTQARKKFRHTAFIALNQSAVSHTYETSSHIERLGEFRVLAIDGSKLRLPESRKIRKHFGPAQKAPGMEGPPMALISQCYDVVNGIILDAAISPINTGERQLAREHFKFFEETDLLLLDRGYCGYLFFQAILKAGAEFCCRVPCDWSGPVTAFTASGELQEVIELPPGRDARRQCEAEGLPVEPLRLRAVRIELPAGEAEILLTSLVFEDFDSEFFKELYHLRWCEEEAYKHLKGPAEMENFSGKSVEAVLQDFYARIFIVNLTAMLALPLQEEVERKTAARKHQYAINWTSALSKVRECGIQLFLGTDIDTLIRDLEIALTEGLSPRRPGRSYERKKGIRKSRFVMNQKRI